MSVEPTDPAAPVPQPATAWPTRRSAVALYVATLLVLLLLRGLTARPSADVPVRNMDEHLMFSVGMSSLTGGPGNTLGWPGGSMRLATTLLVPTVFAIEHLDTIRHHRRALPVAFVQFLGHELREPWRMVGLLRWVAIVLSSIGFACLPLVMRRFTRSNAIAFATAIAALCGGTLWVRSLMATGDAVGWATAVVGIWAALRARESPARWATWVAVAALCAGLATASKLTAIYLWPLIFAASIRSPRDAWRVAMIWLVAAPFGHYLLNPYVFTDPLRVAKAIAGNLLTRPASTPWPLALMAGVPIGVIVGAIASSLTTFRRGRIWLPVATLVTLAMYAMTVRGTRMIEPHYLTPLAIPFAMLVACGFDWLARREAFLARPAVVAIACAAIVATSVALGFKATRDASRAAADRYGPGHAAVRYLKSIGFAGRIGVQPSQSYHDLFLAEIEGDASIADRLARLEAQVAGGKSVVATLGNAGLDRRVAVGLAEQFNDADRLQIANWRSMSVAGVTTGPTVVPVRIASAIVADRTGVSLTPAEAIEAMRRGELDAVLLADPVEGVVPTRDFGGSPGLRSVLYLRDATTAPTTRPGTESSQLRDAEIPVTRG